MKKNAGGIAIYNGGLTLIESISDSFSLGILESREIIELY